MASTEATSREVAMERKAAAGKWKGGRRPFGYHANTAAQALVPDLAEAAIVRLVFGLYTQDRLGARAMTNTLNERGHRTTSGGRWSAHQVLRVLANRVYLGDQSFRGIITTSCHPPVIEQITFEQAQRLMSARARIMPSVRPAARTYLLTGLIRCLSCGSAMLGTRAHGKTRIYRYYTCYRRTRYDTTACGGQRIDADAIEHAVTSALAGFYRHQHHLIADAIAAAQASPTADHDARRGELAATERRHRVPHPACHRHWTC